MYPGNVGSKIKLACSLQKVLCKTKKKKRFVNIMYITKGALGLGSFKYFLYFSS